MTAANTTNAPRPATTRRPAPRAAGDDGDDRARTGAAAPGQPSPGQRRAAYAALAAVDDIVTAFPAAGNDIWQAHVPAVLAGAGVNARCDLPRERLLTRTLLKAMPADAVNAAPAVKAAATRLPGALANAVAAQAKYPSVVVAAGGRVWAVEVQAGPSADVDDEWINTRTLAHHFSGYALSIAQRAGGGSRRAGDGRDAFAGVLIFTPRAARAGQHRPLVGRHDIGDCGACAAWLPMHRYPTTDLAPAGG